MYIGVDIGGTNLALGLVDDGCRIVARVKSPTNPERGARAVIDNVSQLCHELTDKAGLKPSDIDRIGLVAPGSVDAPNGIFIFAGNIPFDDTPAVQWMREQWSCPVSVENDANAAALGEVYAGAARECSSALMVTLGTGVGGGIIFDRKVYSGFNGTGGEIGHMVVEVDGWKCTCGRSGCWEAYSSATGLIRMTREAMEADRNSVMWRLTGGLDRISGKTAFQAMREDDAAGRGVVTRYIKYLSIGLGNLINIFQPEMICIGGGVCNEGDYLMKPLIEATRREQFKGSPRMTEVRLAELGNDAGIIGAAMLGR